jgi:hypothetical protein
MHLESQIAVEKIRCQLSLSFHAIIEMINDSLSEGDIRDAIVSGTKSNNDNGDGDKYQQGCVVVIADNKPCHFNVITTWKEGNNNHSVKDKIYRQNRYMRRNRRKDLCSRCEKANLQPGIYPLEISGESIWRVRRIWMP